MQNTIARKLFNIHKHGKVNGVMTLVYTEYDLLPILREIGLPDPVWGKEDIEPLMPLTGAELILRERWEQLNKHKFNTQRDAELYKDDQLRRAALWILTDDEAYWPRDWSFEWKRKFMEKSEIEKRVIAAAFLAADVDRIQYLTPIKTDEDEPILE